MCLSCKSFPLWKMKLSPTHVPKSGAWRLSLTSSLPPRLIARKVCQLPHRSYLARPSFSLRCTHLSSGNRPRPLGQDRGLLHRLPCSSLQATHTLENGDPFPCDIYIAYASRSHSSLCTSSFSWACFTPECFISAVCALLPPTHLTENSRIEASPCKSFCR